MMDQDLVGFNMTLFMTTVVPFMLIFGAAMMMRRGLAGRQLAYLDHQKGVSTDLVVRSSAFQDAIAKQHEVLNERAERTVAQTAEALQLQSAAIEENKVFRASMERHLLANNERADRAISKAEEAVRVQAAALEQLTAIEGTLARLAQRLEASQKGA